MTDAEITADEAETLVGKRAKFHTGDQVQSVWVTRVDFPYVQGTDENPRAKTRVEDRSPPQKLVEIRVDLREVSRIEVQYVEKTKTVFAVIVFPVLAFVVIGYIAMAASGEFFEN